MINSAFLNGRICADVCICTIWELTCPFTSCIPWLVTACLAAVFFRYPPLLFGIMATERPTRIEIRSMVTVFFIMLARKLCPMKQLCSGVLLFQWDFVCCQHTHTHSARKIPSYNVASGTSEWDYANVWN